MMISRHEGHGSCAKQLVKEGGSMGGIVKGSHLHSQHAFSSGENLSPRSVLEQRALSGLAIAIDLEEKMKQENAILGRFLSKQSIMHMSTHQEAQAKEDLRIIMGASLSRERLNLYMKNEEREACGGLKMVISMHHMSNQEGKEGLMMGRCFCRERMRHVKDEEREGSLGGGGERKQEIVIRSGKKKASSSEDPPLNSVSCPLPSICRRLCKRKQSTYWLHELAHVQQSLPPSSSSMEGSIFYGLAHPSYFHVVDDASRSRSPIEDFLTCCSFCKCRLGAGKDIYMYRGDQAFCSVECRYEQITKDECMGGSAL